MLDKIKDLQISGEIQIGNLTISLNRRLPQQEPTLMELKMARNTLLDQMKKLNDEIERQMKKLNDEIERLEQG